MDLTDIRRRIDQGADPDDIRADLGGKIMECLVERGEDLDPLERIHFGIAIELLPSPWLRLTWTHVESVCNRRDVAPGPVAPETAASAPTPSDLMAVLIQVLADIHAHRTYVARSLGKPAPD